MHLQAQARVLILCGALLASGDGARDQVIQYLKTAETSGPKEARECFQKALRILEKTKELTEAERIELVSKLADALQDFRPTLDDVVWLMGPTARKRVARQVLYRRYLEHWTFESPVQLWITLDYRKGQDPIVRMIRPILSEN